MDTGNIDRVQIIEAINQHEALRQKDPSLIKFRVRYKKDQEEDIMTYNDILNHIERDKDDDDGTY